MKMGCLRDARREERGVCVSLESEGLKEGGKEIVKSVRERKVKKLRKGVKEGGGEEGCLWEARRRAEEKSVCIWRE